MAYHAIAHVKTIHCEKHLGVICPYLFQRTVLPFAGVRRAKGERNLDIDALATSVAYEINLLFMYPANRDLIAPSQEFKIDDILQKLIDISAKIAPDDRIAQSRIHHVEFLVHRQNAFSNQVLSRNAGNQKSLFAGREVVEDGLDRRLAPFSLEKVHDTPCRERVPAFGHHETHDAIQQVNIADLLAPHHVLQEDRGIKIRQIGA